jgi:copper chaperone CopZ
MRELNLFVDGMSCRRCVREVTARLRDVPGVETVSANPGDRRIRLSGSMQLSDVLAAFTGTTYRPQVEATTRADRGETGTGKSEP